MRELKFRAWDKSGKMLKPFYFMMSGIGAGDWIVWGTSHDEFRKNIENPFPPQQFEIMQFTGLKDKNGKEIYEGDIVHSVNGQITAADVRFHEGAFWFHEKETEESKHYGEYYGEICHWSHNRIAIEIIGNIYENPELIKQTA